MQQSPQILFVSLRSPFARRIRLAFKRLGVVAEERLLNVFVENPDLMAANPLGTVPTFCSVAGTITDSANILEYLHENVGQIWPSDFHARIAARQASVWAEGIMQSLVLYYQETVMHEVPSPLWAKEHVESMAATLLFLAKAPESVWLRDGDLTQAGWDLCVALEYMDLRAPGMQWRTQYPSFVALLEIARKDSYFCETTPPA